jgi:osmotically inducible lipoprotein OsmB
MESTMTIKQRHISTTLTSLALVLGLSACAGMSKREANTAVGAVVGGVVGAAATGGSTVGTVGGAVVGGAIGNELSKKK